MDGYKLQMWATAQQRAKELGIVIEIKGDQLRAFSEKNKMTCGVFNSVETLYAYLNGVEHGRSLGRIDQLEEESCDLEKHVAKRFACLIENFPIERKEKILEMTESLIREEE